jgi:hypothetical protein
LSDGLKEYMYFFLEQLSQVNDGKRENIEVFNLICASDKAAHCNFERWRRVRKTMCQRGGRLAGAMPPPQFPLKIKKNLRLKKKIQNVQI